MSRLYDTVEPSVIDEEMLQKAVEEQGPKDEAGKIAKREGINFGDVLSLRLDFKNILKIDNLWEFTSLTKLQLDNNIIERIEGFDVLVNLVWLDLSFNNIEVIEGLNSLKKLEDLTLYNNRISKIENIDVLSKLHVFSIGNNEIKDIKDILYLRKFPELKTLNISNNPVCSEENFKMYVAAFLPNLEFLDYRLLDEQTKVAAYEKYQTQVEEQIDKDNKARTAAEMAEKRGKEVQLHREAYVEFLNTDKLYQDMYADDPEGIKLNQMPGVDEMLVVFKEKVMQVCQQLFDLGLQEYDKRKGEVDMFWECVNEAKEENKEMGMKAIETFMADKKRIFIELQHMTDSKMVENKVQEYNNLVTGLWDALMGLELQLVDQLEEVIKDFERNMQDLVGNFLEGVQGYLTQAREHENVHNEKMTECATSTQEKGVKNELDEDISEDLKMLLVDRDTVMNAVTSSHDVHLLKIDNKEDDIVTRINTWLKNMIETIHKEQEIERNRNRVIEINHLIDHLRDEIDALDIVQVSSYVIGVLAFQLLKMLAVNVHFDFKEKGKEKMVYLVEKDSIHVYIPEAVQVARDNKKREEVGKDKDSTQIQDKQQEEVEKDDRDSTEIEDKQQEEVEKDDRDSTEIEDKQQEEVEKDDKDLTQIQDKQQEEVEKDIRGSTQTQDVVDEKENNDDIENGEQK